MVKAVCQSLHSLLMYTYGWYRSVGMQTDDNDDVIIFLFVASMVNVGM